MNIFMVAYEESAHEIYPTKATFKVDGSYSDVVKYMKENEFIDVGRTMHAYAPEYIQYPKYILVMDYTVRCDRAVNNYAASTGAPTGIIPGIVEVTLHVTGYPVKNIVEAIAKGYFKKEHENAMKEVECTTL